jgi:DNA polymerase-1
LRRKFLPHENLNTMGLNTPIQGTAAEVLNESLARMRGRDVVHHVHDELIAECAPEDAAEVSQHMQQAMEQAWCAVFPALPELARGITEVHHGRNWSEAKP